MPREPFRCRWRKRADRLCLAFPFAPEMQIVGSCLLTQIPHVCPRLFDEQPPVAILASRPCLSVVLVRPMLAAWMRELNDIDLIDHLCALLIAFEDRDCFSIDTALKYHFNVQR